jgi:hypothetical protein
MAMDWRTRARARRTLRNWAGGAVALAIGLSALLILYANLGVVPATGLAAQQRDAVQREHRAFCERHGMPVGTHQHSLCLIDLFEMRQREDERLREAVGGFL